MIKINLEISSKIKWPVIKFVLNRMMRVVGLIKTLKNSIKIKNLIKGKGIFFKEK